MDNLALVVNTHFSYRDLWGMFFDRIKEYFPGVKTYVFSNEGDFDPEYKAVYYDENQNFRSQFLSCIGEVKEKYCIFISEDYILYDYPDEKLLTRYIDVLDEYKYLSFIRLLKGMSFNEPNFKNHKDLYELSNVLPYFYSQSAALWRVSHLSAIFKAGPDLHIAGEDENQQFEVAANRTCQELDMRGLYCYHGEPKRGIYHYDSVAFPHVATAIIKGKWNLSEYPDELMPLLEKHNIDPTKRGIYK